LIVYKQHCILVLARLRAIRGMEQLFSTLATLASDQQELCFTVGLVSAVAVSVAVVAVAVMLFVRRQAPKVMVLDFAVHKPHERWVHDNEIRVLKCFVYQHCQGSAAAADMIQHKHQRPAPHTHGGDCDW
jgi:hypothetical protein